MWKRVAVSVLFLGFMIALCVGANRVWEQCGYDCGVFPEWFPVRFSAIVGVFLSAVGMVLAAARLFLLFMSRKNDGA